MPATDELSDQVCARVHDLTRLAPQVAEDVALAMVTGAARGFREISQGADGEATRRLLAALELDIHTLLAVHAH